MKIFNLIQTRYLEFNQQVKSYLSKTLSNYNTTYGNSTIFGQLINVIDSVVQNILLYIEDSLTEQNKYTAQRKKSIYGLAVQSGYNPSLGKAATCNVKLSFIPSSYTNLNIILKNHTKIYSTQNGLIYNVILPQDSIVLSVDKNNSCKYLQVVEGTFESQEFISQGGQYYTQNVLFNGDMDIDYLEVKINDEIWSRVESLYDMDADGKQYVAKTSLTKGIDLIFGNDQFGRSLQEGDIIKVTYLIHSGELGNLSSQDDLTFIFQDSATDISGEEVSLSELFNIVLAEDNYVGGGTYSETATQVQEMIGFNSRSLVLADVKNYKNLLNKFSFVGYNRTWSEEGSLIVNSLVLRNYPNLLKNKSDYFSLKESDFKLSDDQKTSIMNHISNSGQQLAGVTYRIFDPEIWKYACYIYIKTKTNNVDKLTIESKIRNIVAEFFCELNTDYYIPKSDIIHAIKSNIDEIDSVDVYFLSEKNETAIKNHSYVKKTYTYNITTGIYDVDEETIYVPTGEDPRLGLDEYGNILLEGNEQFPALLGGWSFISSSSNIQTQQITITDPLIITFR